MTQPEKYNRTLHVLLYFLRRCSECKSMAFCNSCGYHLKLLRRGFTLPEGS